MGIVNVQHPDYDFRLLLALNQYMHKLGPHTPGPEELKQLCELSPNLNFPALCGRDLHSSCLKKK